MAKIRLRTGHVELSFEGSEDYIRSEVIRLFREVVELGMQVSPVVTATPAAVPPSAGSATLSAGATAASVSASATAADDPLSRLAAEISVELVHVASACGPNEEEPYLHIDRHYWAALKDNTPSRGAKAIPGATLVSTLLVLWFNHLRKGAPTVSQVRAVLIAGNLDASHIQRSVNNCEWLQLKGEQIIIKPAEIRQAIEIAAAFCEKRSPKNYEDR